MVLKNIFIVNFIELNCFHNKLKSIYELFKQIQLREGNNYLDQTITNFGFITTAIIFLSEELK